MGNFPIWMQIITGLAMVAILIYFGPSAIRSVKQSPRGSASDWLGLAWPIGGVILFVIVLIAVAR